MSRRRWLILTVAVVAIFGLRGSLRPQIDPRLIGHWKHVDDIRMKPPHAMLPITDEWGHLSNLKIIQGGIDPREISFFADGSAVVIRRRRGVGKPLPVRWKAKDDRLVMAEDGREYNSSLDRLQAEFEVLQEKLFGRAPADSEHRIVNVNDTELRIENIDPATGEAIGDIAIYKRISEQEAADYLNENDQF